MTDWLFYAGLGIGLVLLQVALESLLDERRERRHAALRRRARVAQALLASDTTGYPSHLERMTASTEVDW